MKLRFWRKKLDKPRAPDGTFLASSVAPARQDIAKTVQPELQAISGVAEVMKGINFLVEQGIQQRMGPMEESGPDIEIGNEWAPVLQQLLNHVGPYLGPLLEKYGGLSPSSATSSPQALKSGDVMVPQEEQPTSMLAASQPEQPAQAMGSNLIKDAAQHSPRVIKLALKAGGFKELEKQGISREEFKQAITNIYKAIS